MSRTQVAFDLYLFGVLGLVLLAAPWTPLWDQAVAMLLPDGLGPMVRSGWVRGAITGLGAVDLWIALQHAIALWQSAKPDGSAVESR